MSKKQRSPSYPGITLQDAIERARQFHSKEGKYEALVPTALTHWGYSTKSSGGLITVAALKAYGLMNDKGSGAERKVFLTPVGLNIVMDARSISPDRDRAIREAALMPKIMADLWDRYGCELPSLDTLRHYLRVEREFTESAVNDVIKIYIANMEFAELRETEESVGNGANEDDPSLAVADQQPSNPGASPAAQAHQVIRAGPALAAPIAGEEIGNYRVSKNTTIRLISSGPYTRQSIESLVKQLELAIELGNFDDLAGPEDSA